MSAAPAPPTVPPPPAREAPTPPTTAAPPSKPAETPPATPPPPSTDLRDSPVALRDSVRSRRYTARGAVKILRTLEAADARLSGVVSVGGLIDAGTLRLSGRLDAVGGIRVRDRFEYRGEVRALASVEAGEIDGAGTLVVREAARVRGLLRSVGTLRISADLSAGRFVGEGEFEVSGSVVAPEVDFRFDRPSKAAAIRAEWVRIRRGPGLPIPLPPILPGASRPACSVARIEAVEADLEGVECDFLRAERISLGPGCHVARLEGTIVRKHPDAWVGPESRSPPPPGLFR